MSFRDEYELEKDWRNRALLIYNYHLSNLLINHRHKMMDTATYFSRSLAAVSEDIKIAEALQNGFDFKSRNDAILRINGRRV